MTDYKSRCVGVYEDLGCFSYSVDFFSQINLPPDKVEMSSMRNTLDTLQDEFAQNLSG